jgi:hypothetical protein
MANDHQQPTSTQTRTIEEKLKAGQSPSVIARSVGVSWQHVRQIRSEMKKGIMLANALARKIAREDLQHKYEAHVQTIKGRRSSTLKVGK